MPFHEQGEEEEEEFHWVSLGAIASRKAMRAAWSEVRSAA